jgi:hypothetical protein
VKNITVSIDDETYRRARIAAAANDSTVTAVVREFLEDFSANSPRQETKKERSERLARLETDARARIKFFDPSDNVPREELYRLGKSD